MSSQASGVSGGLDRCITSPYVQKTGFALAGMDELDESEIEELPDTGEEP